MPHSLRLSAEQTGMHIQWLCMYKRPYARRALRQLRCRAGTYAVKVERAKNHVFKCSPSGKFYDYGVASDCGKERCKVLGEAAGVTGQDIGNRGKTGV